MISQNSSIVNELLQPHSLLTFNSMSTKELLLLKKLESFEAPWLKEKLLMENKFLSSEEFEQVFIEFKKYVFLVAVNKSNLAMMSKKVDQVWHQFILFTKEYQSFCNSILGFFLHHIPRTRFSLIDSESESNFIHLYRETFGPIPKIWNIQDNKRFQNADCSSSCGADCNASCNASCGADCNASCNAS